MIQRLLTLVRPPAARDRETHTQVAVAAVALLLEVAASDDCIQEDELATLQQTLIAQLPVEAADGHTALIQEALQARHRATCLFEFTRSINRHWASEQKYALLQALWQMAYADGHMHPREEALIRKLADLIHVPQADFVRARQQVERAARPPATD